MAADIDPVLVREHQQSWNGFAHFVKWGTITVAVILLLLYVFVV